MSWLIALFAAAAGYLLGSISSARIVTRIVAPGTDISKVVEPVPNSDKFFEMASVAATAVRVNVGTRYGLLTALLDMLKVALPTLAFRLWQPEAPYYLLVAALGVVGHDWPLYHRFKGGRGESAIFGGFFVVDWPGVLATNAAGILLGVAAGNLLVVRWAGMVLMIPWLWIRTGDWVFGAYAAFVNAVYFVAMIPELKQYFQIEESGGITSQQALAEFLGMGSGLGRVLDRYSIPALLARLKGARGRP